MLKYGHWTHVSISVPSAGVSLSAPLPVTCRGSAGRAVGGVWTAGVSRRVSVPGGVRACVCALVAREGLLGNWYWPAATMAVPYAPKAVSEKGAEKIGIHSAEARHLFHIYILLIMVLSEAVIPKTAFKLGAKL